VKSPRLEKGEIIATFVSHITESYPSIESFQDSLEELLDRKRSETYEWGYAVALEKNIVYFMDIITEGRSLLETLLKELHRSKGILSNLDGTLDEIEGNVRSNTAARHEKLFVEENDEVSELVALKEDDSPKYIERLEAEYRFLFALKLFLMEFFLLLKHLGAGYDFSSSIAGAVEEFWKQIYFYANLYVGNVSTKDDEE